MIRLMMFVGVSVLLGLPARARADLPDFICPLRLPAGPLGGPLWFVDNGQPNVIYDYWDGQVLLDDEVGLVATLELLSASGIFTGECVGVTPPFGVCSPNKIFILEPTGITGDGLFAYATPRLDRSFLLADTMADGSVINPSGPLEACLGSTQVSVEEARGFIDTLTRMLRTGVSDPRVLMVLDLDNDGVANHIDRTIWIKEIATTFFGDATLDGEFNSADLVSVFTAGEYEDAVPMNSRWASGDWNGDGDFTTSDLVVAFQDDGYEQGPRADNLSVPEPGGAFLLAWAANAVALRTRCWRRK